ncbi:MAG: hypothetical protein QM783_07605 [Phycisphaerales bacterium]
MTINDNESTIAVRAQDPTAAEVTTGTQNPGQYRFTRSLGSNVPAVTVYFQMSGTASFTDYTLSSAPPAPTSPSMTPPAWARSRSPPAHRRST